MPLPLQQKKEDDDKEIFFTRREAAKFSFFPTDTLIQGVSVSSV